MAHLAAPPSRRPAAAAPARRAAAPQRDHREGHAERDGPRLRVRRHRRPRAGDPRVSVQRWTSEPLAVPRDPAAPWEAADLEFEGVAHDGSSFAVLLYLDNPGVPEDAA